MGFAREVGPHRVPGICVSMLGFVSSFVGIAMIGMNQSQRFKDEPNSIGLVVGGAIFVTIGFGCVIGGFAHQHLKHKKWKKLKSEKDILRKNRTRVISTRADAYVDDDPIEGTSASGSTVSMGFVSPRDVDFGPGNGLPNPLSDDYILSDERGFATYNDFHLGASEDVIVHRSQLQTGDTPGIQIHCETIIEGDTSPDEDTNSEHETAAEIAKSEYFHHFSVHRTRSNDSYNKELSYTRFKKEHSDRMTLSNPSIQNDLNDSDDSIDKIQIDRKLRRKVKSSENIEKNVTNSNLESEGKNGRNGRYGTTIHGQNEDIGIILKRKSRRKLSDNQGANTQKQSHHDEGSVETNMDIKNSTSAQNGYENITHSHGNENDLKPHLKRTTQASQISTKGKATQGKYVKGISKRISQEKESFDEPDVENEFDVSDTERWDTEVSDNEDNGKFQVQNGIIVHTPAVVEKYLEEESKEYNLESSVDFNSARFTQRRLSNWDSDNDISDHEKSTVLTNIAESLPDLGAETCDSRCS